MSPMEKKVKADIKRHVRHIRKHGEHEAIRRLNQSIEDRRQRMLAHRDHIRKLAQLCEAVGSTGGA